MNLFPLRVTVTEVTPAEGYQVVALQVESTDPANIYCGANFGLMVGNSIAEQYVVGESHLLEGVAA